MAAGAIIAYAFKQPALALPIAFISHFLLDSLPHFGDNGVAKEGYFSTYKRAVVAVDCVLAALFVIWLFSLHNPLALLCAIVAASPDFVWAYRELIIKLRGSAKPRNIITRFHEKIQWGEFRWGWIAEILYLAGFLMVLGIVAT